MRLLRWGAMAAIVAFWAIMWTLLIRSEVRPGETALHALPLDLVLRQYFQHEQQSALFLRQGGEMIGHLRLDPRQQPEGCSLRLVGGMELSAAGEMPQRAGLEMTLTMDAQYHVVSLQGTFSKRSPPISGLEPMRVELSVDAVKKRGHYRYEEGKRTVMEQDFTLDEAGFSDVLEKWGIGPEWKQQLPTISTGPAEVLARQIRITLHEEPVEATLITIRRGGQTWLEATISSLGTVLEAKTLWGWTLSAE